MAAPYSSGGLLQVDGDAIVSGVTFVSGRHLPDRQRLRDPVAATISGGEIFRIGSGGSAADTTVVDAGSEEVVLSGGIASGTVVSNAGFMAISSGGVGSDTTVGNGGTLALFGGAQLGGTTTIEVGGTLEIASGYTESNLSSACRTLAIVVGGTATGTTMSAGGVQVVYSGGKASSAVVNGGQQLVSSGGTAIGTTISAGFENVSNGGVGERHSGRWRRVRPVVGRHRQAVPSSTAAAISSSMPAGARAAPP